LKLIFNILTKIVKSNWVTLKLGKTSEHNLVPEELDVVAEAIFLAYLSC